MIRIRPAHSGDAAAIGGIHVETWQSTYAGLLPADYLASLNGVRRAAWWAGELNRPAEQGRILVAEFDADGVVGFGSCGPPRRVPVQWQASARGEVGEVYTLYVTPDFQNRGVGRALLAGLFARLRHEGHQRGMLWVLALNPSRFFYEAVGGRRLGTFAERVGGAEVEEWSYGWEQLAVGGRTITS